MPRTILSALALLAWLTPVLAQQTTPTQAPPATAAQRQTLSTDPAAVEAQRQRWNGVFSRSPDNIRTDANRFLVQVVNELKPGVAIDIGMGVGRNALYLARHGWKVTGVDVSDVGVQKAREQAEAEKLPLTAIRDDMFKFDYGHDRYDLIVFTYMGGEKQGMADKITDALKPGGLLVIEHFLRQGTTTLGYPPGELPKIYPKLEVLHYGEIQGNPDYGQKQTEGVVQFLARKKP
jgi:SAM-dependent methyltransferase